MILTIEDIRGRVAPVAEKYDIRAVYLFGSYTRNEATEGSDVDILIDREGSAIRGLFDMGGLYSDLCECLGKEIDLVTLQTLRQKRTLERSPEFADAVIREMVEIYQRR